MLVSAPLRFKHFLNAAFVTCCRRVLCAMVIARTWTMKLCRLTPAPSPRSLRKLSVFSLPSSCIRRFRKFAVRSKLAAFCVKDIADGLFQIVSIRLFQRYFANDNPNEGAKRNMLLFEAHSQASSSPCAFLCLQCGPQLYSGFISMRFFHEGDLVL